MLILFLMSAKTEAGLLAGPTIALETLPPNSDGDGDEDAAPSTSWVCGSDMSLELRGILSLCECMKRICDY